MSSLDSYVLEPSGKRDYLQNYGWHFSKKAYQYATRRMKKRVSPDSDKTDEVKPYTIGDVEDLLARAGVKINNDVGYDKVYLATMAKADYYGSSLTDENHLAQWIKDTIDDVDGGKEKVFRHWYSDMIEKGEPIIWEELL